MLNFLHFFNMVKLDLKRNIFISKYNANNYLLGLYKPHQMYIFFSVKLDLNVASQ